MEPLHLFSKYFICYSLFLLLTYISKLNDGLKLFDSKGLVRNPGILIGLHITGILWLGVIPASILNHSFYTIVFGNSFPGIWQWVIFFLLSVIVALIAYTQTVSFPLTTYAGKATVSLSSLFLYKYFILRLTFLIAYETWFRGYLLTDCIQQFGIPVAITINVTLYTLLHAFGSRREMIACIPFGLAVCGLCIWVGGAWPAIVLHIIIALFYEIILLKKFFKPVYSYYFLKQK